MGRELDVADFDLDKLFVEDGVKVLHLSGLVAAISPKASAFCVELARKATENGTRVSMDMNYRASFWKGREEELGKAFHEIAELCDILIGNDGQISPGERLPSESTLIVERDRTVGPRLREVVSVNVHKWGMVVYGDGDFHVAELREIGVLDRVGGGDGSVGGMLCGILQG